MKILYKSTYNNNKGFTLLELIIVIAIISILTAIAIPLFFNLGYDARVITDKANYKVLKNATINYAITNDITTEDIFDGKSTDVARIELLVSSGTLQKVIETKVADTTFYWSIADQSWSYSLYEIASNTSSIHDFMTAETDDYTTTGSWHETEDGFTSSYGLLFLDNPRDEYTITATTQLDEGTSGGYGILFETSLIDDEDTGYALQFDRGYNNGQIIIRPREDGSESGAIAAYDIYEDDGVTKIEGSDPWWSEEHEVSLVVEKVEGTENTKSVSFWVDDKLIFEDFQVESDVTSDNNFTGFRSWGDTTTYENLTLE